jgi:diaminopimelate decarboxylase
VPHTPTVADPLCGLDRAELERIDTLLPYLAHVDGELTLDGHPVSQLWRDGRPTLVYLPDRAVANFTALRDAFARHFATSVHFALKSCYLPEVVRALRTAGAGIEVMSDLEWRLALRYGFAPEQVVANSPARSPRHLRDLVIGGAGLIGVDHLAELDRVAVQARQAGRRARVAVRINPWSDPGTFIGTGGKLGADAGAATELIEAAQRSADCEVVALHAHQLRHCADPDAFHDMVAALSGIAADTARRGRPVPTLNLGGGFEARFLMERAGFGAADFADAAREAMSPLPSLPSVVLEPGRYVVGDAAVAFTSVIGEKVNSGRRWLVSELSSNVLIPLPSLAYHPVPLRLDPAAAWQEYAVGDATCAPTQLCGRARLPDTAARDGLAVLNCGAYTSVYAELWAFALPRIAVWNGSTLTEKFGPEQEARMFGALYGEDFRPAGDAA